MNRDKKDREIILECRNLAKTYKDGKLKVTVFEAINFQLGVGEQVAIIGRSGEGKSTLLHLLSGLDRPSHGKVLLQGTDINQLSEKKRCYLRNQKMGFIYQLHHLLPEFTVLENVCMPLLLGHLPKKIILERAHSLLKKIGLQHRLHHKIGELSGGERQRTAIVRALIANPVCVFADEPTGNLDHNTAQSVYETMLSLNKEIGTSFIIVTHDLHLAAKMDRVLLLENSQLIDQPSI